jgi:hypothetical protein
MNYKTILRTAFLCLLIILHSQSYAIVVYNKAGEEIKVKTSIPSNAQLIDSKQPCKLINKNITIYSNYGQSNQRITNNQKEFVECPNFSLDTSQYLTVNNIFDNEYLEIFGNKTNMQNALAVEIITRNRAALPIKTKVSTSCEITVYLDSVVNKLAPVYKNGCFEY